MQDVDAVRQQTVQATNTYTAEAAWRSSMFFITHHSNQDAADWPESGAPTECLDALVYGTEQEWLALRLVEALRFEFSHRAECTFEVKSCFSSKLEEQNAAVRRVRVLRTRTKRKPALFQWIVARYCSDLEDRLLKEREVEDAVQLSAILADGRACTLLLKMRKHDRPCDQLQMVDEHLGLRLRTLQASTLPLLRHNGLLERPQRTKRKGLQLTSFARQLPESFWEQAAGASDAWQTKPKSAR